MVVLFVSAKNKKPRKAYTCEVFFMRQRRFELPTLRSVAVCSIPAELLTHSSLSFRCLSLNQKIFLLYIFFFVNTF